MALSQLSDDALIQLFLQAHPLQGGNEAFATLWQRYAPFVEYLLQRLTNRLPHGDDRHTFVDEARQQAQINLMRRLSGYRGPDRFRPYLATVVPSAVLDQSRAVMRHRAHEQPTGDIHRLEAAAAETAPVHAELPFRSRHMFPLPFNLIAQHERRTILRLALQLHAQQSHRHLKSALAIRWHYWDERKIADIAGTFHVEERSISRLLAEERRELRRLLKHHFGIEDMSQL